MEPLARRRTSVATLVALAGALLVPAAAAGPAYAEPGCVDETAPVDPVLGLPAGNGCDDSTPPDTTVTASTPPNAAGWVATSTMSFTLGTVVGDGDPGPFSLQCRLTGPTQAHDWRPCTSPVTYTGLVDGPEGYTFAVRAVDDADAARDPDTNPLLPPQVTDTPDLDPTPATVTWKQDTEAPFVFVTPDLHDPETPEQPVVEKRAATFRLNSNERAARIECTDGGERVACSRGRWDHDGLASGLHSLRVRAVDPAGNTSAWSESLEFFVARDVRRRHVVRSRRGDRNPWRTVRGRRWLDGDAVRTRRHGARLRLPRSAVGELRLYAATGPRHGVVQVRVGRRAWHTVRLRSRTRDRRRELIVLDRFSGRRRGRVEIRVVSRGRPVVIDAVVARDNSFNGR